MTSEGKLEKLLTVSIGGDKKIRTAARGCDHELAGIEQNVSVCYILSRIEELPERVLDLLG